MSLTSKLVLSPLLVAQALTTGAPVLLATSWREADGRHVLRFEEPMSPI